MPALAHRRGQPWRQQTERAQAPAQAAPERERVAQRRAPRSLRAARQLRAAIATIAQRAHVPSGLAVALALEPQSHLRERRSGGKQDAHPGERARELVNRGIV